MVLSLLPDRGTERERGRAAGGRGEGHRGGPVQERGEFYSKTQSFSGQETTGRSDCLGLEGDGLQLAGLSV